MTSPLKPSILSERDAIMQRLKDDFDHYSSRCLIIRPKNPEEGAERSFKLNRAQRYIHQRVEEQKRLTGKVRAIILKGRQQGCSTYIQGRLFWLITHRKGVRGFILAHEEDATKNLFEMSQRFYQHCYPIVRPTLKASNAQEMSFSGLDSGYRLGTASNKAVGRSSTIQYLHCSEVGFWANAAEHSKGIMQTVPDSKDTEIFIESTANGMGNYFHEMWQKAESGENGFMCIFVPWYWQEEYIADVPEDFEQTHDEDMLAETYDLRPEQLVWRRNKIAQLSVAGQDGERAFKQEYPFTSAEAFQLTGENPYLSPDLVMRARKAQAVPYGPIVVGVDPAGQGRDRTAIIRRRGRVAYGLQVYKKCTEMEIVGYIHMIILKEKPSKVFIDSGNMGGGIIDRLRELGHGDIVVPVNSAETPLDQEKYVNKRAEMWGEISAWLNDGPVQIPDDDALHADLCGVKTSKRESKGRLLMESKKDMLARGVRSSDCFVAGTLIQTPRGEIPIETLAEGDEVTTPFGTTKIIKKWLTTTEMLTTVQFTNGSQLCGKGAHKIFTWAGPVRLDALSLTIAVEAYSKWSMYKWWMLKGLRTKGLSSEFKQVVDIISQTGVMRLRDFYTVMFGQRISELSQKVMRFITKTMIGETMTYQTWNACLSLNIRDSISLKGSTLQVAESKTTSGLIKHASKLLSGTSHQMALHGTKSMERLPGMVESQKKSRVLYAENNLVHFLRELSFAPNHANSGGVTLNTKHSLPRALGAIKSFLLTAIGKSNVAPKSVQTESALQTSVYNLTLEKHNVYYANGILVFNCADALGLTFARPDISFEVHEDKAMSQIAQTFAEQNAHKAALKAAVYYR